MTIITPTPDPVAVLTLVTGLVLPILVGLVTTRATNPARKAILLAGLSAVTALTGEMLRAAQSGTPYDLSAGIMMALSVWAVAVATHYGLWRPTGAADQVTDTLRTAPGEGGA